MAEKCTLSEKDIPNMLCDIYFNMVKTQKSAPAVKRRLNLPPGKSKSLPGKTFQVNRRRHGTTPVRFPDTRRSMILIRKRQVWSNTQAQVE